MTKYRPYSRREFRRRLWQWVRRNSRLIAGLTAGLLGLLVFETMLFVVVVTPTALSWWLLGAVQVAVVGLYLHFLHASFLANDREAIRHLRGSWGEDNTRSELQRAKRKRLIWGWVDSINLQRGDIDHLVVTRRGGLVVIDTKWRNHADDTLDMASAAQRARLRAEALARTLLVRDQGSRHRSSSNPLAVTPVVVVWGAAQSTVPDGARVEGIEFIPGRSLVRWLGALESVVVSRSAAADLIRRLERFRASSWRTPSSSAKRSQAANTPTEPSPTQR